MRAFYAPATAGLAAAVLGAAALAGCGTGPRAIQSRATMVLAAAPTAGHAAVGEHAAPKSSGGSRRLTAIAFTSPDDGYGTFTQQAGRRCQTLAGQTKDSGAHFGPLARVASWPCRGYPPASALAADGHGDAFLYNPGLYVTHDGGRTWAASGERGTVLAVAAAGRSVWMVRAECRHSAGSCPLRLLESANGGRSWAASPEQPPGATARAMGGTVAQEAAAGQTWLLRTGRFSGYLLSDPGSDQAPLWFTANAGASWSVRHVRCGKIGAISVSASAAPDGTLLAVCAGEPSAGYQAKSAARSTDGGRSWTVHTACPPPRMSCRGDRLDYGYLGQIAAASGVTDYLAGARSSLLVTTDGGIHWRAVRPLMGDESGGTSHVFFVSRRCGFVLGEGAQTNELPTIWSTTDGGRHWSSVMPQAG